MADIADVLVAMNEGFAKLHEKIDQGLKDIHIGNSAHRKACETRFQRIEECIAVDMALSEQSDKVKQTSLWHKIVIGMALTASGTLTVAAMTVIWKLIIGHIDLVAR